MTNTESENVEYAYREAYFDGVTAMLTVSGQSEAQMRWLEALHLWMSLPQTTFADCPYPPRPDGSPSRQGTGWPNHTWQHARCRGYSQGMEVALEAVRPYVDLPMRTRLEKWRDRVLKWRNTNSSRTRRGLPSPPSY